MVGCSAIVMNQAIDTTILISATRTTAFSRAPTLTPSKSRPIQAVVG